MPNAIGLSKLDVLVEITGWHGELWGRAKTGSPVLLFHPPGYGLLNLVTRRDVRQLRLLRQPQFRRAEFAGRVTRFAIHGHWQRPLHPC